MKANELRIGNYYEQFGYVHQADWETIKDLSESIDNAEWCKPVLLTEEWLLKFGFERQDNNWKTLDLIFATISWERLAGFTLSFEKESIFLPHIKYVHQLQNLYFALTGEELQIKEL